MNILCFYLFQCVIYLSYVSLYWQPQQKDVIKALPKPLPAYMVAGYMSNKKEDDKNEDEQEEVSFSFINFLF